MCIKERGAEPSANSGQATSSMFPPSILYFAGGYVKTSYGGQAGQALSEIEGACKKVRRRTRPKPVGRPKTTAPGKHRYN